MHPTEDTNVSKLQIPKWHRRRMAEHSYWPLLLAMVLLSGVAHSAFAQQFEDGSQDLSIGDSEYDTSPSVADDLERDLSAGDDEYDTPLTPDPPAIRPSFPSSGQMRFDGSEAPAHASTEWNISRSNIIGASIWGLVGAAGYAFLWLFAEVRT